MLSSQPTIAIVDDDQAIREALDDLVQSCGYCSALFASSEEYLAYDDRANVDCMLVDVRMPGMSGLELQDKLAGSPRRPPMIFLTSYKDERTRAQAIDGGAFAILGKPVDIDQLIHCLEQALASNNGAA